MRLIPGLVGRVAKGDILLEGKSLLALSEPEMVDVRGREMAMIFQEPMSSLNPVMSIGDQIAEALMLHGWSDRKARHARAVEMLRMVGIPNPEGRFKAYPHEFSGGMRQRVMIAMAVACNPKLLIADEPTTALDVTIQAQVLELMKKVRQETGTAILLISHDLGVIADICKRVVVMYAGRMVEEADIASILRTPAHPYTQGLLKSVPQRGSQSERLYQIAGSVPMAGAIKRGCPFHPRCPMAEARCSDVMPPMFRFADGQRAACWVTAERAGVLDTAVVA